ncbi:MAG: hypothetical protein HZB42_01730 [Sphingobacteriales bacterium]|nr:hypothetical protein [Sphingobacteriales bacterium]
MNDFRSWREERREQRRKMREECRARFREKYPHMMTGAHVRSSSIWTGLFILLIGVAALIKATVTDLPYWFFSWQTFLIALGVFLGIKQLYLGGSLFAPLVLVLVGGAFLVPEIYPDVAVRRYIWPVVLIIIGLFFIFRSRNFFSGSDPEKKKDSSGIEDATVVDETAYSKEDFINATSVFGGTKKNILSKNFKGGHITNIFGGTELYLGQADINGMATIDTTTMFGGLKLIIPSNWTVKSQAAVIFGGIEDKRAITPVTDGTEKTLLIKGTVMFGGIDIKSY